MNPTDLLNRCFVWEPLSPHATCSIVVESVTKNADGDWWVSCVDIVTGQRWYNELTRFDEATKLTAIQISEIAVDVQPCNAQ